MKHLLKSSITALVLSIGSTAAVAMPVLLDGQTSYIVGEITPSPIRLEVNNTFEPRNVLGHENDSSIPNYIEGAADPLVDMPDQVKPEPVWMFE